MATNGTRLEPNEYADLRQVLRSYFAKHQSESVSDEHSHPLDREQWLRMARDVGIQGMLVPESLGGSGATLAEVALVFEEAGRALSHAPLLSTVALATTALLASGDEMAMNRYLPSIADGSRVAAVACLEADRRPDGTSAGLVAAPTEEGWRVDGVVDLVIEAAGADLILVAAESDQGAVLLAVAATEPGLVVVDQPALDRSRPLARIELGGVPGVLIGQPGTARKILHDAIEAAGVCLAAEQIGAAERCLEMAVQQARERAAFGRPIGSFQAVKHKCADMLVELESARALQRHALEEVLGREDGREVSVGMARVSCSEMFKYVSAENIQIHGAMGFSWEFPAHLYFKRATADAVLLGSPREQRSRLAELLRY